MPTQLRSVWVKAGLGIGFAMLSFYLHYVRLAANPWASGWDGYFYLVQLKAWVEQGAMHSPDSSPVHWLLRGLYSLCGDYLESYRLLCAALAAGFSGLWLWLSFRVSRSLGLALVLGSWTLFSPTLAFFAANFPKNLLGIDFLLLFMGLSWKGRWYWQLTALLLAAWSHRLTAGLALIFLVMRRLTWKMALWAGGLLGLALLFSFFVPGLIHVSDLQRFEGAFVFPGQLPHWAFPELLGWENVAQVWKVETGLFALLWLAFILTMVFRSAKLSPYRSWFGALLSLFILLFLPFFKMEVTSMGYRFFLAGILLTPVMVFIWFREMKIRMGVLLSVLLLGLSFWSQKTMDPSRFDPDYAIYHQIGQKLKQRFHGAPPELIIGHKGLAEIVTFETGMDVLPWQPEYEVSAGKLWRLVHGVFPMDYKYYDSGGQSLTMLYSLIREDLWQEFTSRVKEAADEDLLERIYSVENPHLQRPEFLLRNK